MKNRRVGKMYLLVLLIVAGVGFAAFWHGCRVYVPPGHMAVVTAKRGTPLPRGRILARPGEQGVLEDVLAEGRHFLNPWTYAWTVVKAVRIPPGKAGLVTAKVGEELPEGEFLADDHQQGIRRRLLPPGRYRLNPVGYTVELVDLQSVPAGFVGVVTSLSGRDAAPGAFAGPGEKGVRAGIMQPGLYYINPREFTVSVVEVGVNQVSLAGDAGGVVVTKNLAMDENSAVMNRLNQQVAVEQQRRREEFNYNQQIATQSASSRLATPPPLPALPASAPARDPFADEDARERRDEDKKFAARRTGSIFAASAPAMAERSLADIVAAGSADRSDFQRALRGPEAQRLGARRSQMDGAAYPADDLASNEPVSTAGFMLNQFVNFPSRDGFDIRLDMTLEFELAPDKLPILYRDYGDIGQVVDKIVMPQLLSVSRLKGSGYRAVDFVAGEGREKFQNELTETLKTLLAEKNLIVHTALISQVNVPAQILEPLQLASLAGETDLTNKERQNTARKQAELNTEMGMIQQLGEQVVQETAKLKAGIHADQEKQVAQVQAETLRDAAAIEQETARVKSASRKTLDQARAEARELVDSATAEGWGLRVQAFGDARGFALYELAEALNPSVRIQLIHAGDGTLWTDLDHARLAENVAGSIAGKSAP